jgi:hypothetical protein
MFYDSTALDAKASVDPGTVSVIDGGLWAQLVDGDPRPRAGRPSREDFVAGPWWIIPGT